MSGHDPKRFFLSPLRLTGGKSLLISFHAYLPTRFAINLADLNPIAYVSAYNLAELKRMQKQFTLNITRHFNANCSKFFNNGSKIDLGC